MNTAVDSSVLLAILNKEEGWERWNSAQTAWLAGRTFLEYRRQGGPRTHVIPDFLIAAHASVEAGRLAAVDRGYIRRYFDDLELLQP